MGTSAPSVVFVHGIGVRDGEYPSVWGHLRDRLGEIFPDGSASFCFWGGEHGATLRPDEKPDEEPEEAPDDPRVQRWAASLADPWWELTALAGKSAHDRLPLGPPNAPRPGPQLRARVAALPGSVELDRPLAAGHLAAAVDEVLAAPVVVECLSRAEAIRADLPPALARALVVLVLDRAEADGLVLAPGDLDRLEAVLVTGLGGQPMSGFGWVLPLALKLVRPHLVETLRPLSYGVMLARGPIERGAAAYVGDVLVYLARGDDIRRAVAAGIESVDGPVDVIAHSLGGVACFDLLAEGRLANVRTLVTVGTQIPYLYDLDALPGLRRGAPPPTLPGWFNVYDRHDALGFPARDAFPGLVTDHRLDSGLPFPLAHSAYFRNDRFYDLLAEVIGR